MVRHCLPRIIATGSGLSSFDKAGLRCACAVPKALLQPENGNNWSA
jgi:hypothetical protein